MAELSVATAEDLRVVTHAAVLSARMEREAVEERWRAAREALWQADAAVARAELEYARACRS